MKDSFKILVVDDERSNILALNHILKPMYTILAAIDGKTALKIAKKNIPDLILLDVIMPDIDGFEVLAELKRDEATHRIPVIFITGLDSMESEEKGFSLGAVDYITKPFRDAIVKARVKMQLQMVEYIHTIEQLSMIDLLTEIPNRRGFNEKISTEWKRAVVEKEPLSILMLDIDRFKSFNDTYGHLKGDVCLQAIANCIKSTLRRETDLAARWGGEEFAVLLPNTGAEGAHSIAEAIRANAETVSIEGIDTKVTVSIGVNTVIPTICCTLENFISGADKALYEAKTSGRNRVCMNLC